MFLCNNTFITFVICMYTVSYDVYIITLHKMLYINKVKPWKLRWHEIHYHRLVHNISPQSPPQHSLEAAGWAEQAADKKVKKKKYCYLTLLESLLTTNCLHCVFVFMINETVSDTSNPSSTLWNFGTGTTYKASLFN